VDNFSFLLTVLTRWLPSHLATLGRQPPRPTHILFCMVDHYEPGTGGVDTGTEKARVTELLVKYPSLAAEHVDSSGNHPKRTWFFPPHYHRNGSLRKLVSLCEQGYGEIELHLHHGKTAPDTAENLRRTIELCLKDYARFGIFGKEGDRRRYGFIHGDWALNNSLPGGRYCGVDRELSVLHETGCYADLTFPSCGSNNPRLINRIYYAGTDTHRPEAHASGKPARAGAGPGKGLLMIQGPVRPIWVDGRPTFGDSINNRRHPQGRLLDKWIRTSIHISGKRGWIILKVHTHGAIDGETVLGDPMHKAFSHLEKVYNDGSAYFLHYVTARELFNMIRAAEDGHDGNPSDYRDYLIAPPLYDSSADIDQASEQLRNAVAKTYPLGSTQASRSVP
jgi:hypothetical protein